MRGWRITAPQRVRGSDHATVPAARTMLLSIGTTVLDRYTVLARLAVGGMGELWVARQRSLGGFERLVALKTLLPALEADPDCARRFLDEARILSRLNHPNVVSIVEIGGTPSAPIIVMEYLDGPSVGALLSHARSTGLPIPLLVTLQIICDCASGLLHVHRARRDDGTPLGLVHRDVTPQNLVVKRDGVTRLIDFGIAWAPDRLAATEPGLVRGTLPYMSPEQLSGQAIDERSDQFSLGVVLWSMLTGRDPEPRQTLAKPSDVSPGVPPELDDVVQRMTQLDPDERYAHLGEVIDVLAALGGLGAGSRDRVSRWIEPLHSGVDLTLHQPETTPVRRTSRRWPLAVAGVAASVVAMAFAGVAYFNREPKRLVDQPCAELGQLLTRAEERARRAAFIEARSAPADVAHWRDEATRARSNVERIRTLHTMRGCVLPRPP